VENQGFSREALAAWVVALVAGAIGLLLLAFDEPQGQTRVVLPVHEPAAAAADDGVFVRDGSSWSPPQSGSSTAPDTLPARR
jgi:hypothetical protein